MPVEYVKRIYTHLGFEHAITVPTEFARLSEEKAIRLTF